MIKARSGKLLEFFTAKLYFEFVTISKALIGLIMNKIDNKFQGNQWQFIYKVFCTKCLDLLMRRL